MSKLDHSARPEVSFGAPSSAPEHVLFDVEGMTCGACSARIERKLNKVDGVTAVVNYATGRASVTLVGDATSDDVVAAVNATGYAASLTQADLPAQAHKDDQAARHARSLKRRLFVALALFMPLSDGSLYFSLYPHVRFDGWEWVMLALAMPVVTWAAWPFYRGAWNAARHRTTTMDTLVSLGIISATVWSLYSMFSATGTYNQVALYFDVAVGVTTFLLAGRYFEARSKMRAGDALADLAAVGAHHASLVDELGVEHQIPAAALRVGDRFVVRPGETVATDGTVVTGSGLINMSAMTGESVPVDIEVGSAAIGGTIVADGYLTIEATRVGSDTQLAQMLRLVEDAQNEKAGAQRLADRISSIFVPIVMAISLVTLLVWLLVGAEFPTALNAALSVLIIACPCALGLATPTAMMVASGRAAKMGIFFKDYDALEASRRIDTIVLDKTGTLTEGNLTVVACEPVDGTSRAQLLALAGAVEQASEHLVGRAIANQADAELGTLVEVSDFTALAGLGVQGVVEGRVVSAGRLKLFEDAGSDLPDTLVQTCARLESSGQTVVVVGVDGRAIGAIGLADVIRPSAKQAIADFKTLGLRCVLLTGDNATTAQAVADEVGIDEVYAAAMPDEKSARIAQLRKEGRVVAMVGDGINDAPALAKADLGIAVGSGTDAAINAAAVIIMRDDLRVTGAAIALSRRTIETIRTNLIWAFGYNVAAIPLAAFGLLNPLISGAAMALSSAFVVWNSLRLRKFPRPSRGLRLPQRRRRP
ncbi:MAG: cation-translocating P-type ATPase [Candidatus Nanopelagicales bacterium]